MSDIIERARALRAKIEEVATNYIDDSDAVDFTELFPVWDGNGKAYTVGDRVRYVGTLYKVLQAHNSQADWTPEAAPSLFAEVLIPDPEVVPVWRQPDSTNAYMTGDKVHYPDENGPVYESVIDNNVWSPADYPAGWSIVSG